jgi:hypothetical protein
VSTGDFGGATGAGASVGSGGASAGFGLGIGTTGTSTGTTGGPPPGGVPSAIGTTGQAFGSMSAAQQQRILTRCRTILRNPEQASGDQLAVCQTLSSLAQ